uniref:rhamnan synthesis F family protein n=1 Tax=Succinivibrio sp. TaxID=2053619 RepID=UPI00402B01E0
MTYLKYLKEVSDNIIFVADNEPNVKELSKIYPLVSHIESYHHGEYDFGSYKIGFKYAKEHYLLDDVDEIILCNDSCFCVDSLKPAFDKMATNSCDFWSMTASNEYEPHLQSFFLVIKKKLLISEVFCNYLDNVKHLDSFLEIVKTYEIPLKKTFETEGFKSASFIKAPRKNNPTFFPIKCMKVKMPLIKRKIFTEGYACKESLLKVIFILLLAHRNAYKEILNFYKVKTLVPVWFKFFKPKIRNFFFRIEVSSKGTTKIRVLTIPIFILKQKK